MNARTHRYRITITPIEDDGLPCSGRCTLEFERRCPENWTRRLESVQRLRGFDGDERVALVTGLQLLEGLLQREREAGGAELLAPLAPALAQVKRALDTARKA